MTKEVLMQEVKRVAGLLKVDTNLSDAELFSMVTGVTVASFDDVTEDRLAFLYKLIPGGAFVDSTDDSAVEGEDEVPAVDPVADDDEPTVAPVVDDVEPDTEPEVDPEVDPEVEPEVDPEVEPTVAPEEPEVEPEEVEDDEKSEATVEE